MISFRLKRRASVFLFPSLVLSVSLLQGCASVKTIDQETMDRASLDGRIEITSNDTDGNSAGKGAYPRLKALGGPPKRVALVSYYVQSPVVNTKTKQTVLTDSGVQKVVANLYKKSIDAMKANFKENGMELLEPAQYLTDDTKKKFYSDFNIGISGGAKMMKAFVDWAEDSSNRTVASSGGGLTVYQEGLGKGAAAVEGYRLLPGSQQLCGFASVTDSIGGDLSKGLGVDAVLIAYNEVKYDGKSIWLTQSQLYMYGPNPIPLKEEDLGGWSDGRKGHLYGSAVVKKLKGVSILPPGADDTASLGDEKNYAGYDRIADGLSRKLASYVKRKTTEQ